MSKRIQQVNQLIQKELSQIILKEVDFPSGALVTVTRVETSVDLNQSRVYISVIPEKKLEIVLDILDNQIYDLQQDLNKRLNMRPVPRIRFIKERNTITAGRVEELLEKIKRKRITKKR